MRTPQCSRNSAASVPSRLSAVTGARRAGPANGFNPTGAGLVGSITTTSSWRPSGTRASRSVARSPLGSSSSTARWASTSARARDSSTVDFPVPVGPSRWVWKTASRIGIATGCLHPGVLVRPMTRSDLTRLAGGGSRRGCRSPRSGSGGSPIGQPHRAASCPERRRSGQAHGRDTRLSLSGVSALRRNRARGVSTIRSAPSSRENNWWAWAGVPVCPRRRQTAAPCCSLVVLVGRSGDLGAGWPRNSSRQPGAGGPVKDDDGRRRPISSCTTACWSSRRPLRQAYSARVAATTRSADVLTWLPRTCSRTAWPTARRCR